MPIPQFIRDNTDDGRDIIRFLIDVMNGSLAGSKLCHRLTAARLLVTYERADASDFIVDNSPGAERSDEMWATIDPGLSTLIKVRTDDGRVICMFLIDVMEGRIKSANAGHRVSATRELLNRAFGKSPGRSLPRPPRPTATRRTDHGYQWTPLPARPQAATPEPTAPTAVLTEPEQEPQPEPNGASPTVHIDTDDPLYLDEDLLEWFEACYDPEFDPYEATRNERYAQSFACTDPKCEVHGEPDEIEFDPKDFHY